MNSLKKMTNVGMVLALGVFLVPIVGAQAQKCEEISKALSSAESLKPGMQRKQVEQNFERRGSTFRNPTVYAWKHCSMLKVTIHFEPDKLAPKDEQMDRIVSVSEMVVGWPVMD